MPSIASRAAVGVEADVHRGRARKVDVLRHDLPVCGELSDEFASLATNLPSPCEMGTLNTSPALDAREPGRLCGSDPDAHDARLVAADVVIGERGAGLVRFDDLPEGHEPELDERLEAVADAAHEAVAAFQGAPSTCSFTSSLRKKAVMNLPEPSGSSPPEKPPGIKTMLASLMREANASTERATSSAVLLRMTKISGVAPASANALAVSYSQLVPGNTGMSTLGLAVFTAGARLAPLLDR